MCMGEAGSGNILRINFRSQADSLPPLRLEREEGIKTLAKESSGDAQS